MSADATINVGLLRAFVERIERVEADIKDLNGDKSDIYKEARGYGYDVKAIRAVVSKRKLDSAEREERDAIFGLYWDALNGASRVHVHEAEEFDTETGEVIEDQPETETEFGSGPETHNSHPVGRVSDAQGNALRHGAVAALAPEANLPSTGVIPSAGCTAPSESAADEISESVQTSSPEPIKAGALSSSLSVPAILSDEEVVPAFMKNKQSREAA